MTAGPGLRFKPVVEVEVANALLSLRLGQRLVGQSPEHAAGDPGPYFDAVQPRLAFDLRSPSVRILDLIDRMDHLASGEQLPVVISPSHPFNEHFDSPLDLDRILHVTESRPQVQSGPLQTFMGHSNIQTTFDIYGHLLPGSREEVRLLMDEYLEKEARNAGAQTPEKLAHLAHRPNSDHLGDPSTQHLGGASFRIDKPDERKTPRS